HAGDPPQPTSPGQSPAGPGSAWRWGEDLACDDRESESVPSECPRNRTGTVGETRENPHRHRPITLPTERPRLPEQHVRLVKQSHRLPNGVLLDGGGVQLPEEPGHRPRPR